MGSPAFFTNHQLPHTEAYNAQLVAASNTASKPAPSGQYKGYINTLISALIGGNSWYYFDGLWVFSTEQQCHAVISVVNPAGLNAAWPTNVSEVPNGGTLTWTANNGYTGDGSKSYLNLNYIPSNGPNWVLNSASFGYYGLNQLSFPSSADYSQIGVQSMTNYAAYMINLSTNGSVNFALNSPYAHPSGTTNTTKGLISGVRKNSTQIHFLVNGVDSIGNIGQASDHLPSTNLYALAAHQASGSPAYFSPAQLAMAFAGSGSINQLVLYNAFYAFITSI